MKNVLALVIVSFVLVGCGDFGGYPQVAPVTGDAGPAVFGGDAGPTPPAVDAGTTPQVDSGTPTPTVDSGTTPVPPVLGAPCDPDLDTFIGSCTLSWCAEAYMVCAGSVWGCFAAGFDCHEPAVVVDAGHEEIDAGIDAGPACVDGALLRCDRDCGGSHVSGVSICLDGAYGTCRAIPGIDCPATGVDAGVIATVDAGTDAGSPSVDAGVDAYVPPPAVDAGVATHTVDFLFNVEDRVLQSESSMVFFEETAATGASSAVAVSPTPACEAGSGLITRVGLTFFKCRLTRRVGYDLYYTGSFTMRDGTASGHPAQQTFSAWNNLLRTCGDAAATTGTVWRIEEVRGGSIDPGATYSVEIVQARSITADGVPVCRGYIRF